MQAATAAAGAEPAAADDPATGLRATHDWVCAAFPPALRHWFAEAFRSPPSWHAARTAYTRSTAAASMAGYVIGLGDRHAHNILVDGRSAEVVHIDLGVAFEQGRFLGVPELVPFRLTRDVVDGMGPAGVEGPFRRCCEAALAVLRAGREPVSTVVGVLVHDPLYRWQLSPVGARRRQGGGSGRGGGDDGGTGADDGAGPGGGANADAARALLRVRQKLAGLDGGGGDGAPLSAEAQVRMLLHEAADPGRLCRMYVGWAPFL
jgi:serine-protein kinase ATM